MWRSVFSYLCHTASTRPRGWHPLLTVLYLTYACDFRCPFCSDGAGNPYYRLHSKTLRGEEILELLRTIRRHCDHIVLTGGEPTKYPDFGFVLEHLPEIGFDGVILTTIGHDLEPYLEAINDSVHHLVFSLETLDQSKADTWLGRGEGTLTRILGNIDKAAALRRRGFEIIISSVATPENLTDLLAVYAYARERGFGFALCPQLLGVHPHPELAHSSEYRRLFDLLIDDKRRGCPINGSVAYLEHMRELAPFSCRPSTVLAVSPSGDVFYPCLERGTVAGNLHECPDLHQLRRQGQQLHGPEPTCGNHCHSACALGFALALNHPLSLLHEAALKVRARLPR